MPRPLVQPVGALFRDPPASIKPLERNKPLAKNLHQVQQAFLSNPATKANINSILDEAVPARYKYAVETLKKAVKDINDYLHQQKPPVKLSDLQIRQLRYIIFSAKDAVDIDYSTPYGKTIEPLFSEDHLTTVDFIKEFLNNPRDLKGKTITEGDLSKWEGSTFPKPQPMTHKANIAMEPQKEFNLPKPGHAADDFRQERPGSPPKAKH